MEKYWTFFGKLVLVSCSVMCSILWMMPFAIGQNQSPSAEEITRLIGQLGAEEFGDREAATKALKTIGEPALEALRKAAAGHSDIEVRGRAERLAEVILEEVSRAGFVRRYQGPGVAVYNMAISPDGQQVFCSSGATFNSDKKELMDLKLRLWELKSGKERLAIESHPARVGDVAFSPDGRLALSTGFESKDTDCTVRLWSLETGQEVRRFEGHTSPVYSARFSPDGRNILTASSDGTVRLWDVESGKELRQFETATRPLALFSPDGRYVLALSLIRGDTERSVRLWDVKTGQEKRRFGDRWAVLPCLAFSPDGRQAAIVNRSRPKDQPTAPPDFRVYLWAVDSGQLLRTLEGHQDMVVRMAFSPDGRRLLSADRQGSVRLWDVSTGKELRRFKSHTPFVLALAFSADGSQALTGHTDNSVTVWALPK